MGSRVRVTVINASVNHGDDDLNAAALKEFLAFQHADPASGTLLQGFGFLTRRIAYV